MKTGKNLRNLLFVSEQKLDCSFHSSTIIFCRKQNQINLNVMNEGKGDGFSLEQKLMNAIQQELEKRDILKRMKAEMCAEVLEIVRYGDKSKINEAPSEDSNSPTYLLNQLIMEYFDWMNFHYSSGMLSSESGITKRMNRKTLEEQFKYQKDFDEEVPLILSMMMRFMKNK